MRAFRNLLRDERGATLIETTIIFSLVLILTFGIVEFGNALWQYHCAEKATAMGARWLATRAGVGSSDLSTYPITTELYTASVPDCFVGSPSPSTLGTPCSQVGGAANGLNATCTGSGGGSCSSSEMAGLLAVMQQYAPTIAASNVSVQLRGSTMGFLGRGRAIPLITVQTTGLTYNWVAIGALLGIGNVTMPSFASTLPAEDQKEGPGI